MLPKYHFNFSELHAIQYNFNYVISIGQNMDSRTLTALMFLFSNYYVCNNSELRRL
jgi:hypothetical protein